MEVVIENCSRDEFYLNRSCQIPENKYHRKILFRLIHTYKPGENHQIVSVDSDAVTDY